MAEQISVNFSDADRKRIEKKLSTVGALKSPQIITAFRRGLLGIESTLKKNVSGPILHVRSGHLRNSIGSYVFGRQDEIVGRVGSGVRTGQPVKYANILEKGGIIKPVRAKMLAIPIGTALTPAGVPRFTPNDLRGESFIARSRNNNLIIFRKSGKNILPMFVLKKQVKIPAFYYLSKSLTQSKGAAVQDIESGIDAILEGKG